MIYEKFRNNSTSNKQELSVIKAFFKALKINFKMQQEESPYDPEFVEKIKESLQQVKEGKTVKIDLDDIWTEK